MRKLINILLSSVVICCIGISANAQEITKKSRDSRFLAIGSMSVMPQESYGLMLGYVKKWGGYAKFRSDYHFGSAEYICDKQGNIDGGGLIWTNGLQRKSRLQATGGALFSMTQWLYSYAGVGYGYRSVQWQDYYGKWAKVSDYSCNGISAEAGLILKIGPAAVSIGLSTTAFRYTDLEIGVGVMF